MLFYSFGLSVIMQYVQKNYALIVQVFSVETAMTRKESNVGSVGLVDTLAAGVTESTGRSKDRNGSDCGLWKVTPSGNLPDKAGTVRGSFTE